MQNDQLFSRLVVEPVENGFVVLIEGKSDDKTYVFASERLVMKFIKEQLKQE